MGSGRQKFAHVIVKHLREFRSLPALHNQERVTDASHYSPVVIIRVEREQWHIRRAARHEYANYSIPGLNHT